MLPKVLTITSTLTFLAKLKTKGPATLPDVKLKVWRVPFCLKANTLPFHPSPVVSVNVRYKVIRLVTGHPPAGQKFKKTAYRLN